MKIEKILSFFGTNELVLGIASLCGIVGFILTIIVTIRTAKISKILRYNEITSNYNKERTGFQRTFEGHRVSITEDNIRTDKILKDILKNVEEYRVKFQEILSFQEKLRLQLLVHQLKKEADNANWNSICNGLAILAGHLSKKGEKKNG